VATPNNISLSKMKEFCVEHSAQRKRALKRSRTPIAKKAKKAKAAPKKKAAKAKKR